MRYHFSKQLLGFGKKWPSSEGMIEGGCNAYTDAAENTNFILRE
jgi:hypothetical protein